MDIKTRFLERVTKEEKTNCWIFEGATIGKGYRACNWNIEGIKTRNAHRAAYLIFRGDIPKGMQVDHICRNRACSNPNHLEVVSCQENLLRGDGHGSETHCPAGHEYNEENTFVDKGNQRHCRVCDKERKRVFREKNREKYNEYMREYRKRKRA